MRGRRRRCDAPNEWSYRCCYPCRSVFFGCSSGPPSDEEPLCLLPSFSGRGGPGLCSSHKPPASATTGPHHLTSPICKVLSSICWAPQSPSSSGSAFSGRTLMGGNMGEMWACPRLSSGWGWGVPVTAPAPRGVCRSWMRSYLDERLLWLPSLPVPAPQVPALPSLFELGVQLPQPLVSEVWGGTLESSLGPSPMNRFAVPSSPLLEWPGRHLFSEWTTPPFIPCLEDTLGGSESGTC